MLNSESAPSPAEPTAPLDRDSDELTPADLDAAAGGDGVSPNVKAFFDEMNQTRAVQFDLPNYVEQNLPLPEPRPGYLSYPFYDGLKVPGP